MRPADLISSIDRLQQRASYKVIASIVVVVLGIGAMVGYVVRGSAGTGSLLDQLTQAVEQSPIEVAGDPGRPESEGAFQQRSIQEMNKKLVLDILRGGKSRSVAAWAIAVGTGVALAAVWLGISLTYVGLGLLTCALYYPLAAFDSTRTLAGVAFRVSVLAAAFVALVQGVRIVLANLPGPVFAIARNVVSESIRLRIGVVFLVVLIVGLAVMPLMLNEGSPLRYRVQAFLQYATSFAFWTLAFLTVVQCASSVAFEQRDKVIWQTMTKPVRPWVYLLGKWTGVAAFNAVLLGVSGVGIFLFVEHLRSEKALGEVEPYVSRDFEPTEDRRLLHTRVLQSRDMVNAAPAVAAENPDFVAFLNEFIQMQSYANANFQDTPETREKVRSDLLESINREKFQIPPASAQFYTFKGLGRARELNVPLTLRYKIVTPSKRMDHEYQMLFTLGGNQMRVTQTAGVETITVIDGIPPFVVDPATGDLSIAVVNYGRADNPAESEVITIERESFQVQYASGMYQSNFLRAFIVLWVKLGFIAMVAITMATFLSFPVTILIAFSVLFMAEGAGYINKSVEYFSSGEDSGFERIVQLIVYPIARTVGWIFTTYHDINPVSKLVDGLSVTWGSVALSSLIILSWIGGLFLLGSVIFSKRELAIYSGN